MDGPSFQTLFNIALGLISFIGGIFMRVVWDSHKEVRKSADDAKQDVRALEKEIAAAYVRKDDFYNFTNRLTEQLNRIEDKIDRKADK